MAKSKRAQAHESLAELTRLSNKMRALDREAMDFGTGEALHTFEIHTIDAIGKADGRTVNELAQWFYVTKGAVSQVVSRLTRLGYVTKERNPANGKEILLALTAKGETALAGHDEFHHQIDADLISELRDVPVESVALFNELLGRISRHMDRYIELSLERRKGVAA